MLGVSLFDSASPRSEDQLVRAAAALTRCSPGEAGWLWWLWWLWWQPCRVLIERSQAHPQC
jgi:hypothetical protein